MSSGEVFRRFLEIHEFVLHGASKINYFRSRRVRWCIREVQYILFSAPIFEKRNCNRTTKIDEFSGKVVSPSDLLIWGGPAGGEAPGKVFRPLEDIPYDS